MRPTSDTEHKAFIPSLQQGRRLARLCFGLELTSVSSALSPLARASHVATAVGQGV